MCLSSGKQIVAVWSSSMILALGESSLNCERSWVQFPVRPFFVFKLDVKVLSRSSYEILLVVRIDASDSSRPYGLVV